MNPNELWEQLGIVNVTDDGSLLAPFLHFPVGTHRETVWHWFEQTFTGFSVARAMGY